MNSVLVREEKFRLAETARRSSNFLHRQTMNCSLMKRQRMEQFFRLSAVDQLKQNSFEESRSISSIALLRRDKKKFILSQLCCEYITLLHLKGEDSGRRLILSIVICVEDKGFCIFCINYYQRLLLFTINCVL